MRFLYVEGEREALRSVVAHVQAHAMGGAFDGAPAMPPAMLAAIGVDAADMLELRVSLGEVGTRALVQLLVTPLDQLVINHVMIEGETGGRPPSDDEASAAISVVVSALLPAVVATAGTSIVAAE